MQKYLSLTGHVYDPAVLFMSTDDFDELSADDMAVFLSGGENRRGRLTTVCVAAGSKNFSACADEEIQVIQDADRSKFAAEMASADLGP